MPDPSTRPRPSTLGELRASGWTSVPVKAEIRRNAAERIRSGTPLFPEVLGYAETVFPQLENALLRAGVLASGHRLLLPEDFDLGAASRTPAAAPVSLAAAVEQRVADLLAAPGVPPRDVYQAVLADVERPLLRSVLDHTGGNQVKAADVLGINRNTLRKKLTDLDLPVVRGRDHE